MKRLLALLIVSILLLSGCNSSKTAGEKVFSGKDYQDEQNDELMLSIIQALEDKDNKTILDFFIPLAHEEAINLEGSVAWMMSFYQGSMESWVNLEGYRDSSNHKETSVLRSMSHYLITTSEAEYDLYLHRREIHTANRDEKGLYKLKLTPADGSLKNSSDMLYGGICIADQSIAYAYTQKIIAALEADDLSAYDTLLLPELRDEHSTTFKSRMKNAHKGTVVEYWGLPLYANIGYRSKYSLDNAMTRINSGSIVVKTTEGLYMFELQWLDVRYAGTTPNTRYLIGFDLKAIDEIPDDYLLIEPAFQLPI